MNPSKEPCLAKGPSNGFPEDLPEVYVRPAGQGSAGLCPLGEHGLQVCDTCMGA